MRAYSLVATLLPVILGTSSASVYAGNASIVYDFVAHYSEARVDKVLNPGTSEFTSGGVKKHAINLHPMGKEDATVSFNLQLPKVKKGERLILVFGAGMGDGFRTDDPAHPSDGVIFKVRIGKDEKFKQDIMSVGWVYGAIDLTGRAGKSTEITFATNAKTNSNYDWAAFGQPLIVKLGTNELFAAKTVSNCAGIVTAKAETEGVILELTPLSESGTAIGQPVAHTLPKGIFFAVPFDFTRERAYSVRVTTSSPKVGDLAAYGYGFECTLVSFGPSRALPFKGEAVDYRCVVRNTGHGLLPPDLKAKAQLVIEGSQALFEDQQIGALFPGEEKSLQWSNVSLPASNQISASIKVTAGDAFQVTVSKITRVANRPAEAPSPKGAECITLSDGSVVLQNPAIRMTFHKVGSEFIGWTLSVPEGDQWRQVASGSPLGKIVTSAGADGPGHEQDLVATEFKSQLSDGSPVAQFTLARRVDNAECRFEWKFTLDPVQPKISASHSVTTAQPIGILHFSGPMVYAGDGSFGGKKDEALFPGLEYLLTESSSGTENVSPPNNLRTVPHPNKITIPFMAVRSGKNLIMLEWDPLQKWDGSADRPAAVFASPNFLDGQDNHKMGLLIPSVPEWTRENCQTASKPYMLEAGKSLVVSGCIRVKTDSTTIIDAVDAWIGGHGVPDTAPIAKSPGEVMALCEKAYLETIWDPQARGWKHTNTSSAAFDSQIAAYLLRKVNFVINPERKKTYASVVQAAIDAVGKNNLQLDAALLAGGVGAVLSRMAEHAKQLIATQREDGSWPFKPDEKHSILGKTDDTSSGHCATSAVALLEYALIANDQAAIDAGLKALKYLDTQTRPEGAQTWELQLHVPDILASSKLVRAYTLAYQLTEDKKYLDRAVYWAKTGLPFVYLWSAVDRPIMLYGTIPVFGATWFNGQPWFGVCVQWCGMDYAYSLARLSDFDQTLPWGKIAEGIFYSGAQQQELITKKYPAEAGLYPDAYSPVKGDEEYHWSLNPGLLSKGMIRLIGSDCYPYTYTVKDGQGKILTLTLPVQGAQFYREADFIKGSFRYMYGATIYMILSGVYYPDSVTVNTLGINKVADVESVEEGWQYFPETSIAIIKMKMRSENNIVIDILAHQLRPEDWKELEKKQQK